MNEQRKPSKGLKIGFLFVPFPQEIWDQGINLSHNGFRLLGYLIRHIVCFHNKDINLTDDEVMNGRKRQNGQRYDSGCGIKSRNGLKEAREELEYLGWLRIDTDKSDQARIKRYYTLLINPMDGSQEDPDSISNYTVSKNDTHISQNDTRRSKNDTRPLSKNDTQVSQNDTYISQNDTYISQNDTRTNILGLKDTLKENNLKQDKEEKEGISHSLNATPFFDNKMFESDKEQKESSVEAASKSQSSPEKKPVLVSTETKEQPTSNQPLEITCNHPAIAAVRKIVGRFPSKLTWPDIVGVLGDHPDVGFLEQCAKEWGKKSSNMGNLSVWLFEWYKSGLPLGLHQGSASSSPQAQTQVSTQQQVKKKLSDEEFNQEVLKLLKAEEKEKEKYGNLQ